MQVYAADWVLPVDGPPIADGAVAVENGRIAAVETAAELGPGRRFADAVIVPGFVNAHSHLEYAVYAGFGDGLADFSEWIALHVERKDRIGWDDFVAIAELGAAECLASGVTTVGDCSFSGAAAVACAHLGLRATVYLEVFGAEPDAILERFGRLHGQAADAFGDLVRPGVSPHAPYTCTRAAYEAAASLGLPIATHVSESPAELDYLLRGEGDWAGFPFLVDPPGTTGTRLLDELGLLGPGLVAAHCTHVDDEEIALLARSGTGVAHCPRSNALLGCGVAPLRELRAAGVRVGLGTDSPASTPSFDFFEELRTATMAARARDRRPDALLPAAALELATLGGARALCLEKDIGSLTPGKRADLAVVSLADSPFLPWEDPAAAVVFGGSPDRVLVTLVEGAVRYEKGGTEWQEVRQRATNARSRMLAGDSSNRSVPARTSA
jgi:cytosine/adenosine deaminase-related metal-dependent hydrolase